MFSNFLVLAQLEAPHKGVPRCPPEMGFEFLLIFFFMKGARVSQIRVPKENKDGICEVTTIIRILIFNPPVKYAFFT